MTAIVEVLYWRGIPAAVKARGPAGTARADLPARFARAVAKAADSLGGSTTEDYWLSFRWEIAGECSRSTADCAEQKAREIERDFPPSRLNALVELAAEYEPASSAAQTRAISIGD